jgi:hypothetical protein
VDFSAGLATRAAKEEGICPFLGDPTQFCHPGHRLGELKEPQVLALELKEGVFLV